MTDQSLMYWHLAHTLALRQAGSATVNVTVGNQTFECCDCAGCADYVELVLKLWVTEVRSGRGRRSSGIALPSANLDLFPPTDPPDSKTT